jgi:hypothetical protein
MKNKQTKESIITTGNNADDKYGYLTYLASSVILGNSCRGRSYIQ